MEKKRGKRVGNKKASPSKAPVKSKTVKPKSPEKPSGISQGSTHTVDQPSDGRGSSLGKRAVGAKRAGTIFTKAD